MKINDAVKNSIREKSENIVVSEDTYSRIWDDIEKRALQNRRARFFYNRPGFSVSNFIRDFAAVACFILVLILVPIAASHWKNNSTDKVQVSSEEKQIGNFAEIQQNREDEQKQVSQEQQTGKTDEGDKNSTDNNQGNGQKNTAENDSSKYTKEELTSILDGVWMKDSYINSLSSTKSPVRALQEFADNKGYLVMWFYSEGGEFYRSGTYELHQGTPEQKFVDVTDQGNNSYRLIFLNSSNNAKSLINIEIDKNSGAGMKAVFEEGGNKISYTKICKYQLLFQNDVNKYINAVVLAGDYVDESGKKYTFTSDNKAIWPQAEFNYSIGDDTMLANGNDAIYEKSGDKSAGLKTYIFEIKDNYLYLYNATSKGDNPLLVRSETPFAKLKKTK